MGWRVTGQRGTEDLRGNGRFESVMVVSVETDTGTTQDFRIPTAQYTEDTVKAIVNEWYERESGIAQLRQG